MQLDNEIYALMADIDWFSQCGSALARDLGFAIEGIATANDAVAMAKSSQWQDVRTEAQGDLTGYLARYHSDAYCHWNELAKASRRRIQEGIQRKVSDELQRSGLETLVDTVLLDLNRIALQAAYAKQFRRVPGFFHQLFAIYQSGHLPCGWNNDLSVWPQGHVIIY